MMRFNIMTLKMKIPMKKTADDNRDKINITLNNGITIKQRKSFRVIRYVRYNRF